MQSGRGGISTLSETPSHISPLSSVGGLVFSDSCTTLLSACIFARGGKIHKSQFGRIALNSETLGIIIFIDIKLIDYSNIQ